MKKLLTLLSFLLAFSAFAQKPLSITTTAPLSVTQAGTIVVTGSGGGPVSVTGNTTTTISNTPTVTIGNTTANPTPVLRVNDDLEQRAEREGETWPSQAIGTNMVWNGQSTGGGTGSGQTINVRAGKAIYMKSLTFSSNRAMQGQSVYGSYNLGSYPNPLNGVSFGGSLGEVTLSGIGMIKSSQTIPGFTVIALYDADPRTTVARATNGSANLTATKSANNTPLTNNLYSYTVTVTNTSGGSVATGTTVTDPLPSGVYYVAGAGTNYTVSATGQTVTATYNSSLAASATSTFSVTVTPSITYSYNITNTGYEVDMDDDYASPNIMPICGTSISDGTGATSYATQYSWLLRNWIRDSYNVNGASGYRVRRINKAISGSQTSQHEDLRTRNRYNFDTKTGVFIYEHGVNDVSQSISTTLTQANLSAMIKHKQRMYPSMTMLVLAPIPNLTTATESGLVTLSAALSATVQSFNDPKVIYVWETRACLNATTDLFDGTHPNDSGQTKMFNAIVTHITNYNIQFGFADWQVLILLSIALGGVARKRKNKAFQPRMTEPKRISVRRKVRALATSNLALETGKAKSVAL